MAQVAGNKAIAALQRIVTVPLPKAPRAPAGGKGKGGKKAGGKRKREPEGGEGGEGGEAAVVPAAKPIGQAGDAVLLILDEIDGLVRPLRCHASSSQARRARRSAAARRRHGPETRPHPLLGTRSPRAAPRE